MASVHIRLHKGILWLILDRPPLNTLTVEMITQLGIALQSAVKSAPSLVVLGSVGEQAFCAGLDLPDDSDEQKTGLAQAAQSVCSAFETLRAHALPTAAVVRGNVFGVGCELASLCDTIIAHQGARFRLPAMNAKLFPCAGSASLPTLMGQEMTTKLMKSGETLDAREAMQLGLVHQVLAPRRFVADTEELLVMLASQKENK